MFNEDEDWNDERDAQILTKTVLRGSQKTNSSTNVKAKVVGKKSLLRTLETLGSVPEWTSDNPQQDSDTETEAAPSPSKKKKKKRRKKRRRAETSEEQQENGDTGETVQEDKPKPKMKKRDFQFGARKADSTSAGGTEDKEVTDVNKPQNSENISRQQWKNKMKNKRKCKNKYRQNEPEEEVNKAKSADTQEPKEEVKTDSCSNNNRERNGRPATQKKKEPQKRKKTEEKPPIEKGKITKCGKAEKSASESSADGSKQKAGDSGEETTEDHQRLSAKPPKAELSKEQSLKRQKLRQILHSLETERHQSPAEQQDEPAAPEEEAKQDCTSFRSRMEQRLEAARFRYINEVLYSTSSGEAKRMFKQDPQAFWVYHKGYTAQVQRWPANPVDAIISYIQQKLLSCGSQSPVDVIYLLGTVNVPHESAEDLLTQQITLQSVFDRCRREKAASLTPSSLVVADFGCGDCKIARSVKNKVHSFDLAAACELVTVCDMANVPLKDASVNIAVFCLSLMGTNLADFLAEANRVLKTSGVLKVAEVASRFDNVRDFITALANLGFKIVSKDTENTHFYSFEFVKTKNAPENVKKFGLQLKPCMYKKR